MAEKPRPAWGNPPRLAPVRGQERFRAMAATVQDFWRWAYSDLRMNVIRGELAEFLVAKAVGVTRKPKVAWDNYDVRTPSGITIEVKSSAYCQSWTQSKPSQIVFTGLTARTWKEDGSYTEKRGVRAELFVFAVQACPDPKLYDPLDVSQWRFWVLPAQAIEEYGTRSVGLAFLNRYATDGAGGVPWQHLRKAIEQVAGRRVRSKR